MAAREIQLWPEPPTARPVTTLGRHARRRPKPLRPIVNEKGNARKPRPRRGGAPCKRTTSPLLSGVC
eukprot:6817404-Prymnesium_polylepis.1